MTRISTLHPESKWGNDLAINLKIVLGFKSECCRRVAYHCPRCFGTVCTGCGNHIIHRFKKGKNKGQIIKSYYLAKLLRDSSQGRFDRAQTYPENILLQVNNSYVLKPTTEAEEYKKLIEQGHTFASAGATKNVTGSMVWQSMYKYYPDEVKSLLKKSRAIRHESYLKAHSSACRKCGFITIPIDRKSVNRKYCYTCQPSHTVFKKTNIPHCRHCQTTTRPLMKACTYTTKNGEVRSSMVCRDCNTAHHKQYRSTPNGKSRIRKIIDKFEEKNPHKRVAWDKVRRAIVAGKLHRPSGCSQCFKPCKPDAHHHDYTKPLEVCWLCKACHRKADAALLI